MARVTVEDCIDKVESPYELVLVAKERATQLNSGVKPTVDSDNDKNTVIALREIGEGKVSVKTLRETAINKLRKHQKETEELEEADDVSDDNFDKIYKGEISKSGTAILPSKRTKRIPEKVNLDYKNLKNNNEDKNEESKQQEEPKSLSTDNVSKE